MHETVRDLLREANGLPEGVAKLALVEEAARIADSHGDVAAGFAVRSPVLMWAAINAGQPEKLLVAFSWCLAQSDRDPARFPPDRLLWEYSRWVIDVLCSFPQFSRQQLTDALDDMDARFRRSGRCLRVVAKQRCLAASFLGDAEIAERHWREWQQLHYDADWDDLADECCDAVRYLLEVEREDDALAMARPICEGRMRSDVVPHNVFGCLLLPLAERGRHEEVELYHRQAVRLVSNSLNFLGMIGYHLEFLAFSGDLDTATALFERHLPLALATTDPLRIYFFHQSAGFYLRRLARDRPGPAALRLPLEFSERNDAGRYDPTELAAWFSADVRRLGMAFDERAGNDWFSRSNRQRMDRLERVVWPPNRPEKPRSAGPKSNK